MQYTVGKSRPINSRFICKSDALVFRDRCSSTTSDFLCPLPLENYKRTCFMKVKWQGDSSKNHAFSLLLITCLFPGFSTFSAHLLLIFCWHIFCKTTRFDGAQVKSWHAGIFSDNIKRVNFTVKCQSWKDEWRLMDKLLNEMNVEKMMIFTSTTINTGFGLLRPVF